MARSLRKRVVGLLGAAILVIAGQAGLPSKIYAADLEGMSSEEEAWVLLGAMLVGGSLDEFREHCRPCVGTVTGYVDYTRNEGRGDGGADLEERVAELEATTARKGNRRVSLAIGRTIMTHYYEDSWQSYLDSPRFGRIGLSPEDLIQSIYGVTETLDGPHYQLFFTAGEYNASNLRRHSHGAWTPGSFLYFPGGNAEEGGQEGGAAD